MFLHTSAVHAVTLLSVRPSVTPRYSVNTTSRHVLIIVNIYSLSVYFSRGENLDTIHLAQERG